MRFACLFMVVSLVTASCGQVMRPALAVAEEGSSVIMFFFLVNKSGRDVKLRVLADGRDLFVQEVPSKVEARAAAEEVLPSRQHPARELKAPLSRDAQHLGVEELNSGMKMTFQITNFTRVSAGFRVTIGEREIRLDQDYFPVR